MKKTITLLLIVITTSLASAYLYLLIEGFKSPIKYDKEIIIRNDGWGSGYFAAHRNGNRRHEGLDLLAEIGTPVYASRSGIVVSAKETRGMGKYVFVRHVSGYTTLYGHLSAILVRKGQLIRRGQIVGLVGKTGNANNRNILSHLHFELKKKGIPQDPLAYLD
jgi:murein DD-endopeptidase MepM/ murein hydrolase activator NlpD